jgi:hypothetical protein
VLARQYRSQLSGQRRLGSARIQRAFNRQVPATGAALGEALSEARKPSRDGAGRRWVGEAISEKTSLKASQYLLKNSLYFGRLLFLKSLKGALVHPSR